MNPSNLIVPATLLLAQAAAAQSFYEAVDIGVLPGQFSSTATDINQQQTVIGNSGNRAFVYSKCKLTDLGDLGGNEAAALDLNEEGVIVGKSRRQDGLLRAFRHSGGIMQELGGAPDASSPLKLDHVATAISSFDVPVGVATLSPSGLAPEGVVYLIDTTFPLPKFALHPPSGVGPMGNVTDVNDSMRVTGTLQSSEGLIGLVSRTGLGPWARITGLPALGPDVAPNAINEKHHTVGQAGSMSGAFHAFLSTDPTLPATDLGTLGGSLSAANDINNNDFVVGFSISAKGDLAAFLHNGKSMIDLNSLLINGANWQLTEATAINDNNEIVGLGFHNGQVRAFLLLPRSNPNVGFPNCGVATQGKEK